MTPSSDPFDALHEPVRPTAPDPAFAARLRDRLGRLLLDPAPNPTPFDDGETTMSAPTTTPLRPGDLAYTSIWTPDVVRAERFYRAVLGWETAGDHAGRGRRVASVRTDMGMFGGMEPTLSFCAVVEDLDATVRRVRAAGGTAGEVSDEPWGPTVEIHDDQGLQFAVYAAPAGRPAPEVAAEPGRPGELAYVSVHVPDAGRARAFYGSVLGWEFTPGRSPGNWSVQVDGGHVKPMTGLRERPELDHPVVVPMFSVADAAAATDAVRRAGGTAEEPDDAGYGTSALCTDDQGGTFWVCRF